MVIHRRTRSCRRNVLSAAKAERHAEANDTSDEENGREKQCERDRRAATAPATAPFWARPSHRFGILDDQKLGGRRPGRAFSRAVTRRRRPGRV